MIPIYFARCLLLGREWTGLPATCLPGAHCHSALAPYVLRFDDAGRIACCEEVLNPINKFNSIGVSIPSFPYYF